MGKMISPGIIIRSGVKLNVDGRKGLLLRKSEGCHKKVCPQADYYLEFIQVPADDPESHKDFYYRLRQSGEEADQVFIVYAIGDIKPGCWLYVQESFRHHAIAEVVKS